MALALLGEIAIGGAYHTGKANSIGIHRLQLNVGLQRTVLLADA